MPNFVDRLKYLGFIFDAYGGYTDPDHGKVVRQMPAPKNISSLRAFLGLVSYYIAFLPYLHLVSSPLNMLLRKGQTWCWSYRCKSGFDELKMLLASDVLLTRHNPSLPIIAAAGASNYGFGAVISHRFPDGSQKAVTHAPRKLTSAERN